MDDHSLIKKLIPEDLISKINLESFYFEGKTRRPILKVAKPLDQDTEKKLIGLLGQDLCINQVAVQSKNPEEFVNRLLEEVFLKKATDIHIDPHRESATVRIRLDGNLFPVYQLSLLLYQRVLNHIKIRSHLNIAEKRLPQEGGFSHYVGDQCFDIRISIISTCFGEKMAIRLLPSVKSFHQFSDIGFPEALTQLMTVKLRKKTGSIFISGPTGSGKSSTLHVFLQYMDKKRSHAVSIEDPIEIYDQDINQLPVSDALGLSFAQLLKRVLRQDPDIILIGEIRDPETARLACEASLTGHYLLSTIHAKDGESLILRLLDMGLEPYLLASSLEVLISQRLIRKNCPYCCETVPIDPFLSQWSGMKEMKKGKGCEACYFSGYRYRTGLFEVVVLSDETKRAIANIQKTSSLKELIKRDCLVSLKDAGLALVRDGITTVDEVYFNLDA